MFGSLKRPAAPSTRAALLGPIEKPQTGGSVPPAFSYPVATSLTANSYELARPAVHVGKFGLLNVESRSVILRSECRTDRTAVDAQVQKPQNNQVHFTPIVSEFSRVEVTIEKPPSERVELHPTFQRMQFAIEVIAEWQAATSAIELLNSCGFLHVEVSIEKPNCEALHFQPELRASRFWSDKFSKWWVTSSELNTLQSPTTAIGTSDLVDAVLDWQRNYLASRNTEGIAIGLAAPGTASIPVALRPPKTKGRIFVRFCPGPLKNAGDESRKEASRQRAPDDDPFASLFYLLLAQKNWDVRVKGLDALLAAYPENKRPFRFQFEGIQFLASRKRALLADEMGLGKTVQAILAMRARIHAGMVERVLITCPKSLLPTWYTEISIWAPELSVTVVHGPTKQDAISRKHHVYITNYETVTTLICGGHGQHQREIKPFDLLIVDEIQFLKNASSKKSIAVSAVIATQRWALTGTPLENSFDDYRTVWNVISPKMKSLRLSDKRLLSHTKGDVLRREKAAVLKDLPKKVTRIQLVDFAVS